MSEIETAEEKHIRRSREPELEWEDSINPFNVFPEDTAIIFARTKKFRYGIMIVKDKIQLTFNDMTFKPASVRIKYEKYYWNKVGFKDIDQAKLAAHEHWRENGYE